VNRRFERWSMLAGILLPILMWWTCLPDPLFEVPYSTVLLDRNEELLGARVAADGQWRFPAADLVVPETFEKAIIAFEDKRFYSHWGVDVLALGRALRDNISHRGITSGGSTLTMQAMRLARAKGRRTVGQKLAEMMWAWRAEVRYSKQDILRLYAAHAPFGGNVVGLNAASWRYFHKTPEQLSWGEAATLAVLPNAPGLIHPGRNRDALLDKRNALLKKLAENGTIDAAELSLALDEPIPSAPHPLPDLAPHLLSHYARSGKTWRSELDESLQVQLTDLVQRYSDVLAMNGVHNAGLLVMETNTGIVRAYVGNTASPGNDHHNDVDMVLAERSSGSILKPFLYSSALAEGLITPRGLVEDIPTYIDGYQPRNFTETFSGMVPADAALAMSLNVPSVRLLQQYGILPFMEKLKAAGIRSLHYGPDHYGLTLMLGGAEVTLWDICGAYASMARVVGHAYRNDHQYDPADIHPPRLWSSDTLSRRSGQLQDDPPVFHAGASWLTLEAMTTLRRPDQEGQWESFATSRRIAWKTGTSFGYRDAWAVGITPGYTVGVWVGNADGEGRPGVIGLHAAAPLLFDVFRMLHDDSDWFSPPYDALNPVVTCAESGWPRGESCSQVDTTWMPRGANMPKACSFHYTCITDASATWRYAPRCQPSDAVRSTYFIVPPIAESYYKRTSPSYRLVPPWHPHCGESDATTPPLAILYPRAGAKIYVPYEWDRKKSRAVFTAVHRSDTASVYWHLDRKYIGKTRELHQLELDPEPGPHVLVLQDETGALAEVAFEVFRNPGR